MSKLEYVPSSLLNYSKSFPNITYLSDPGRTENSNKVCRPTPFLTSGSDGPDGLYTIHLS